MPVYRFTMFFGQDKLGWSETYYKQATSVTEIAPQLTAFMASRCAILTDIHKVDAVRMSTEGNQRQSKLFTPGPAEIAPGVFCTLPFQGSYPVGSQRLAYDQVRACIQLDLSKLGIRQSIRYLDGIPDETTATENASLNFGNPPVWWNLYRQWITYWKNNGWAIKFYDKSGGNPERRIDRWVVRAAAPNIAGIVVNDATPVDVVVGDRLKIRGVKMKYDGIRSPNGTWIVDEVLAPAVPGTQTIYLRSATDFDTTLIKSLGFARKLKFDYLVPDVIEGLRAGIHKRGKRFGTPLGRKKTIRYAN